MANDKNIIRGFRDENGNTAKYAFSALAEIPEEFEVDKIQSTVNDIKETKKLANDTKENLLTNYYTKSDINDKLNNLEVSDEKLQSYYNKTETDKKIEDYTTENFYNKGEIDTKLSNFSPENVYTKTEADSKFAEKTELETVTEHVKELPISTFNNDAKYVTEENAATKADIETAKANIQANINELNVIHRNQAWKDLGQFTINGEVVNPVDSVVSLPADKKSYTLSGYLRGCIEIGREFYGLDKGGDGVTLILDNVYIDSPYTSGIVYLAPKKKMKIKIEDNSYNYIYCGTKDISGMEKETTDFRGAIYSFNNMLISGTGYLTIENIKGNSGLGHGIKASELEIIGKPNIYVKSNHDAFHAGKKLIAGNGIFTVEQANDAFGTGDNGYILIFGGKYNLSGITSGQNCFDSNQQGYILNQKVNFDITTNVSESYIYRNMSFIDDSDFASYFESPKIEYYSVSEVGGKEVFTREAVIDSFPETQYILSTSNNYIYNTNKKALTIYVYGNFADKEIIIPANTTDLVINKVNIKLVNAIVGRIQTSADRTQVKVYDLEDESKVNVLYNASKSPLYLDDDLNINNDCPIAIIGNGEDASVNASEIYLKGNGYKHILNISGNLSLQGSRLYIGGDDESASKNGAGGLYIEKMNIRLSGSNTKGDMTIYNTQTNDVIIDTLTAATSAVNNGNAYVLNDVASNVTGFKKLNPHIEPVKEYSSESKVLVKEINLEDLYQGIINLTTPLTELEYDKLKNNEIELKLVYIDEDTGINSSIIFKSNYSLNIPSVGLYTSIVSNVNANIFLSVLFGTLTIYRSALNKLIYTPYVDVNPKYDEPLERQEVLKAIDYDGVPALNHSYRVCRMKYDIDSKFFITDSTLVDFIYTENNYGIGESFETRLGLVNKKSYSVFSGLNSIGTGIIYDTETHKVIYVTIEYISDTSVGYKIKMELHAYQDGEDITDAFISTKLFNASEGGAIEIYVL